MDIVKIKDQLGAILFFAFIYECFHFWVHFLKDVNIILMSAFVWNEWTYVSDIFVILNFADAFKKRINSRAKKNENEKCF